MIDCPIPCAQPTAIFLLYVPTEGYLGLGINFIHIPLRQPSAEKSFFSLRFTNQKKEIGMQVCQKITLDTLLYGNSTLSLQANSDIFEAVQLF